MEQHPVFAVRSLESEHGLMKLLLILCGQI